MKDNSLRSLLQATGAIDGYCDWMEDGRTYLKKGIDLNKLRRDVDLIMKHLGVEVTEKPRLEKV
jgi:hypothetical protein